MNCKSVSNHIINWLSKKLLSSRCDGFVVGVSGGVDSAVTSTLAAMTGKPVLCLNMPIRQESSQFSRSLKHIEWLSLKFSNVEGHIVSLDETLSGFESDLKNIDINDLAFANLRSRLRMCALYALANTKNYLVLGTGNKIEDYGIGFFTKYGDGGVDVSPIADLLKSEVYELASYFNIIEDIQKAPPTDGLWPDNRGDEDQIGATYDELEWAYGFAEMPKKEKLTERQYQVLDIYMNRHVATKHKLQAPPVCLISDALKLEVNDENR